MSALFKSPILQAIDQNGDPVPGAKLFVFASGTTTPVTVYSDEALSAALPNPVIANARGYFANSLGVVKGIFWAGDPLRLRLTDASDAVIWEIDNFKTDDSGGGGNFSSALFNPSTAPDNAAVITSGNFGGGFVMRDGAGRIGMWSSDTGDILNLGAGGTSASIPSPVKVSDKHLLVGTTSPINENMPTSSIYSAAVIQDNASPVNVRAFGANPAASAAANSTAFAAAATFALAAERPIYIPAGSYNLAETWALSGAPCRIYGDGADATELRFGGTTGGVSFTGGTTGGNFKTNQATLENFRVNRTAGTGGDGISLSFTASAAVAMRTIIRNVTVVQSDGVDTSIYWQHGINLENAGSARLENVAVQFYGSGLNTTAAINITGSNDQSYFGVWLTNCDINGGDIGIKQRGWMESIFLSQCMIVGCRRCVEADASAVTLGNPDFRVFGGHYNGTQFTFRMTKWRAVAFVGVDIYSGVGSGVDVTGINAAFFDCDEVSINGCKVESAATNPGTIDRGGYFFENCTIVDITGGSVRNQNLANIALTGADTERFRITAVDFFGHGTKAAPSGIFVAPDIEGDVIITGCYFENAVKGVEDAGGHALVTGCIFKDLTDAIAGSSDTAAPTRADGNTFANISGSEKTGEVISAGTHGRGLIRTPSPPSSASAPGTQGQYTWDGDFWYVCTTTNTWKRAALSTW